MAVDVPERLLRGVPDLVMLVEAVLRADTEDETDWLEWKSSLDLSNHHGIFAIAKCILALGNRHPDHAAAKMGGLGFMIVGAAGGQGGVPEGVEKLDEVVLAQRLGAYLGNEHPQYDARYLTIQDRQVLVTTVEPPKWGDPVWVTWKGYQPENDRKQEIPEASVYVRIGSQSVRAKAAQFKVVEHRSRTRAEARVTLDIDVEVLGKLLTFDTSEERRLEWVSQRRQLLGNLSNRNGWSLKVEEHLTTVEPLLEDIAFRRVASVGANKIQVRLGNNVRKNLKNVIMTLRDTSGRIAAAYSEGQVEHAPNLPDTATPFRSSISMMDASFEIPRPDPMDLSNLDWAEIVRQPGRPLEIRLRYDRFIRVEGEDTSAEFYVFLTPGDTEPLVLEYRISSTSLDSIVTDTLVIPVTGRDIALLDVIKVDEDMPVRPSPPENSGMNFINLQW